MADVYNFDGFQIPTIGVVGGMTGDVAAQGREFGVKMSNFGALVGGPRMSDDYTRTTLGSKDKDELMNPSVPSFTMDGDFKENPFVWGSTVKRIRNDEFMVMGMGNRINNANHDAPKKDISDTNLSVDDGTNKPKSFPTEGWHTFGGRTAGPFGYITPGTQAV